MGVGAWGYGSGATTGTDRPFSLQVQGVEFIGWVPIESIRVETSLGSNATCEFDLVANPPAISDVPFVPHAFADMTLYDATAAKLVFSGLVQGVELVGLANGDGYRVRCTDYGVLLDRCPMKRGVIVGMGTATVGSGPWASTWLQTVMGQAATGPITAIEAIEPPSHVGTNDGRIQGPGGTWKGVTTGWLYEPDDAGTGDSLTAGVVRSNLETITERVLRQSALSALPDPPAEADPFFLWVDPERRLVAQAASTYWNTASFAVSTDSGPNAGTATPMNLRVEYDYTELASGVFVSDTNTSSGGDNSNFVIGDKTLTNGYYICDEAIEAPLATGEDAVTMGNRYLYNEAPKIVRGELDVVWTASVRPGDRISITSAALGLSGYHIIHTVSTQFLPSSNGARLMSVTFTPASSYGRPSTRSAMRAVRRRVERTVSRGPHENRRFVVPF